MAIFLGLGLGLIAAPDPLVASLGWFWVVVFAPLSLRLLFNIVRPTTLALSPEGFAIAGIRTKFVPWSKLAKAWSVRTPMHTHVFYALTDQTPRKSFGLWVFRGLPAEADGYLPPFLRTPPVELAGLMNQWKAAHDDGRA